ncbi:hypothetical protein PL75_03505 [Neisseria arctica]|uniref:DUF305 domain-containing protein n=1 Tax=Neisseria arctica TaxID=1470200 RepID=A0A0J1C4R0_9NEIS|nr:DUF305 domain-containing protein [Neisseria arctica]KLT73298.1 hypothetical protein PL75_03505 [Neisseria arctica]
MKNRILLISNLATAILLSACHIPGQPASMHNGYHIQKNGTAPHIQAYLQSMEHMHHGMNQAAYIANPDAAFNAGMIPHHQGAVAMAEIELKYGQDPTMRKLAKNIIAAQKAEIETMSNWLKQHPTTTPPSGKAYPHTQAYLGLNQHHAMADAAKHPDPDIAFAQAMIPHHQGAIDMAEIQLRYGTNPATRKLAESIIAAQRPEIDLMRNWLKSVQK